MSMSRARVTVPAIAVFALVLLLATFGVADAKKKKGKSSNVADVTKALSSAIPDYQAPTARPLESQIVLGKAYKGKLVSDVDVTVQTTGTVDGAANDLIARLIAPSGRAVGLFTNVGGAQASIGPLTLDDDTRVLACNSTTPNPCLDTDPYATLPQPFAGRAAGFADGAYVGLNRFYGVGMRGTWTLAIWDASAAGPQTSTLTKFGLRVTAVK